MSYTISPTLRDTLDFLERLHEKRAIEHPFTYNGQDGVASTDPANMRAPWTGATPPVQGVRHSGVDE